MPFPKCTLISEFILSALLHLLYPENIFLESCEPDVICISLINLNNREKASETRRMLKDYALLKPRKSSEKGSDRHRFLQALKRSPYVTILPHSTKDKKFIILKRRPDGFMSPSESPEIHQCDTLVPQLVNDEAVFNPPTPTLHEEPMNLDFLDCYTIKFDQNSGSMESTLEDQNLFELCEELENNPCGPQPIDDSVTTAVDELSGCELQVLQPMVPADSYESV